MKTKFNLYRYSSKYEYEVIEYRNNVFYAIYSITKILKEKEKKDQYEWLVKHHPELII